MSNQTRVPSGRPTGGQFAASEHAESDVALPAPEQRKIMATVNFQVWRNDYAIDVSSARFDAAPILASMTREYREEIASGMTDADIVYLEARRLGLVEDHDGPFWVDVTELSEAMEDGWDPEPTDTIPTPSPVPFDTADERNSYLSDLEGQIGALPRRAARAGLVAIATEIRDELPEVAYFELRHHEYRSDGIECEAAYGTQHEPLDEEAVEKINGILRYYDADHYAPVLHEEFEVCEAAEWHPGKEA